MTSPVISCAGLLELDCEHALWGAGGAEDSGLQLSHFKTRNPIFKKRNFERLILTSTKSKEKHQ